MMIEEKTKGFLRRLFALFAAALVLSIPLLLYVGPFLDANPTFDGSMPTGNGLIAMGALVLFSLILLAILLFSVIPALVELVKAIVEARRDANGDMFP